MSKTIRIAVTLAAVGGMTLAAASASFASPAHHVSTFAKAPKAGVCFLGPETFTSRWIKDAHYFNKRLLHLDPNVKIYDYNANKNIVTQQQNAASCLAHGAKVAAVAAVDQNEDVPIVANLERHGVKVLAYDRMIQYPKLRAYDSFNNVQVGVEQGKWLASHVKKGGTIVEIRGSSTDHNAALFLSGFEQSFTAKFKSGYFKLGYYTWTPNWTPSLAGQEMAAALTKLNNKVNGVYSMNDAMAADVYAQLSSHRLAGTPMTGQDAQPDGLGRILAHEQGMTVYKPIYYEAQSAAQVAYNWLVGRGLPKNYTTKCGIACAQAPGGATKGRHVLSALYTPISITIKNVGLPVSDGYDTWAGVCSSIGKPTKPYCGLPH